MFNSDVKSVGGRHGVAILSAAGMRALAIVIRIVLLAQLARILAVEDFAAWMLLQNVGAVVCVLSVLSLDHTFVRILAGVSHDLPKSRTARLVRVGFAVATISSLVCLCVFTWGLSQFSIKLPFTCALAASTVLVLNGLHQLAGGIFRGLHRPVLADAYTGQFGGPIAMAVLFVIIWAIDRTRSVQLFDLLIAADLTFAVLLAMALPWFVQICAGHPLDDGERFRDTAAELGSSTASMMLSRLMAVGVNYGDVWVAGFVASGLDLGTYGAARNLLVAIITPLTITSVASMASVASIYASGDRFRLEYTLRAAATVSVVGGVVVAGGLLVCSDVVASLIFGSSYSGVVTLLPVMMAAKLAHAWGGMSQTALNMTQYEHYNLRINAICFAVVIIGGAIAMTLYGIIGLVSIWAAALILQAAMGVAATRVLLGIWVCPYHDPRFVWRSLTGFVRRGSKR